EDQRVLLQARGAKSLEHLADSLVERGEHGRVSPARVILDLRKASQSLVSCVHRGVNGVECNFEKERSVFVAIDETDGLAPDGVSQILFLLDNLRPSVDRSAIARTVGMGSPQKAVKLVKAAPLRMEFRGRPKVPLTNQAGCIPD